MGWGGLGGQPRGPRLEQNGKKKIVAGVMCDLNI